MTPSPAPSRVEAEIIVREYQDRGQMTESYHESMYQATRDEWLRRVIATALQAAEQRGRQEGMREMREREIQQAAGERGLLMMALRRDIDCDKKPKELLTSVKLWAEACTERATQRRALPIDGEEG